MIDNNRLNDGGRYEFAVGVIREAGDLALRFFDNLKDLVIEKKGHQDLVSQADKEVELYIRESLSKAFPEDQIIGEEGGNSMPSDSQKSEFIWVIDPIDGTANFVSGIPVWCVVIALVHRNSVVAGLILDPVRNELFEGVAGVGSFLNHKPMSVSQSQSLSDGSVAVGFSNRSKAGFINCLVNLIVDDGGVFYRNASGALSLAYVAAGRLIGYSEDHMNAWDYLAGQLMVKEAGGQIEEQDISSVLVSGGRVVAAAPGVFDDLQKFTDHAMK
ncbi:MAG: inositol monophosphatase [Paracoccaceae bacterium]|jgi:myo-inositol-1(or 4)-monophosphatase